MSKRKRKQDGEPEAAVSAASSEETRRLLPVDVQQKEFRLAFRGYNESDVDEFLDNITEELARLHEENKRLSERSDDRTSAYGGMAPGALIEEAQRRAEEIVREAREQAAIVLATASRGGPGGEAPDVPGLAMLGSGSDVRTFLAREREFLQGLAGLIQSHAEAVKQDAQRARTESPAPASAAELDPPGSAAPVTPPVRLEDTGAWSPETEPDPWSGGAAGGADPRGGPEPLGLEPEPVAPAVPEPGPELPPALAPEAPIGGPEIQEDEDRAPWSEPAPAWSNPFAPATSSIPEPREIERLESDFDDVEGVVEPPAPEITPEPLPPVPEPPPVVRESSRPEPIPPTPAFRPQPSPREPDERDERPGSGAEPVDREENDRSLRELFWGEE